MSDTKPDNTPDALTPSSAAEEPSKPKKQKKPDTRTRGQKWRRRTIVVLVTLLVCFLAVRALVPLLLPTVLRQVASNYDLNAEYDKFDFNLLGGDVGLWNLRFTPKSGGDPILTIGYCRGAVATLGLLQGRLDVQRAEAEDATVIVERMPDGSIPLLERFLPKPDPTAAPATTQPTDIPLESPLSIDTLRLQRAEARLIDRAVAPTTDVRFYLNLILTNIGKDDVPTAFSIQLNSPEVLGALYVDGSATARNQLVNADLDVRMIGLNLKPLRSYLAAFGVTPVAGDISATAKGELKMTPAGGPDSRPADAPVTAVAIELGLRDITLTADSQYAASVKNVNIDVPSVAAGEIRINDILVDGVRAYAMRDPQGRPTFAGIALGAEPTDIVQRPESTTQPADTRDAPPAAPSAMPIIELNSLLVRNTGFQFTDFGIDNPQNVFFDIDRIALTQISTDPAKADVASKFTFNARSSGLAEAITVTGDITAATPTKTLDLKIDVSGISGSVLDPYLKPLGISRAMKNARLTADVSASIDPFAQNNSVTTGLTMKNVKLVGQDQDWFSFDKVDVSNVRIAKDGSRLSLGNVAVSGPTMSLTRAPDGSITTLGFTFDPSAVAPAVVEEEIALIRAATQPVSDSQPIRLPVVEIGKLTWDNVSVSINDAAVEPAVSYKLVDVDVRIEDLTLDQNAADARPGKIAVSLQSPGNIDSIKIGGTVAPTGEAIRFDLSGESKGTTLAGLRPLLNTFGIEPVMKQGQFQFAASGDVRKTEKAFAANLSLKDVSVTDQANTWVKLASLDLKDATFDGNTIAITKLDIAKPELRVERDEQGRLVAAGLKLITPPNAPPPSPVDPTAPPIPSEFELALPIVARLNEMNLNGASVTFVDHAVTPTATLKPTVSLTLKNAVVGADAKPASFSADLSLPGAAKQIRATGTLSAAPASQGITVTVTGNGIGGEALAPYLPPGITTDGADHTLTATVDAQLAKHPQGGSSLALSAKDVELKHDPKSEPALALTSASLKVNRFDLAGKVIDIDHIATRGFVADVSQDQRGILLPMFVIGTPPKQAQPAAKQVEEQQLAGEAIDVDKLLQSAKIVSPLVTLKSLDVGAKRLSVKTNQMAYPVAVRDFSLTSQDIQLLGERPEQQPPFTVKIKTNVEKLVDAVDATATIQPFAKEPSAKLNVDVTGIRGDQVTSLIPSLANQIDGSGLSDGRFTSDIEAQLTFTRRGLFGIDMTRDMGARSVIIKNTKLTQAGRERPLLGVEEVNVEQLRISQNPTNLTIKSVDIVKPAAHIWRDKAGIHAAGMMYRLPVEAQPETQPAPIPPKADEPPPPVDEVAEKVVQQVDANTSDITINTLTVSGCDVLIEDFVGTPTTRLPFTAVDIEVKGLTTRAMREPLPVRFTAFAESGKVPFLNADGSETEPSELFAQFIASGVVQVYPKPQGWLKMSLSAWDLRSVKGIAQQLGIEVSSGALDFSADVRMEGTDTFEAKLYPTLNSVRIKDSPDGKLTKLFQLGGAPAPIDQLIVLAEDADGALSLPTKVPYKAGELDMGTIITSATGSVGGQLIKAFAAVPAKALAMIGIDLNKEQDLSPVTISFDPGESRLTTEQEETIEQMVERLKKDDTLQIALEHRLSTGDFELANQRANPTGTDAKALAENLRQRKFDLQKRQVELSSKLRVALASQNQQLADQTLQQIQSVSKDLAQTEEGLDDMLGLFRAGAERYTDRRAKQAAIELAQWRLDAIREQFLDSDVMDIAARIGGPRPDAKLDNAPEQSEVVITFGRRAKE